LKKDLCELQGKHQEITRWLAEVRDKAIRSGTQLPWVNELRNAAYDIEDLLYEVDLKAEKYKIHSDGDKQPIADCFCAKPKSHMFRREVASKIKAIKVKYEKIVKQASDATIIRNNLQMGNPVWSSNTRTAGELSILCNVEDSKIPRRDREKDEIISTRASSVDGELSWRCYGRWTVRWTAVKGSQDRSSGRAAAVASIPGSRAQAPTDGGFLRLRHKTKLANGS